MSQPLCREDDWSEEDGIVGGLGRGGGHARSLEARVPKGSGIGHFFGDNDESFAESHTQNGVGKGKQLKVLAAKRILKVQKEAGVSFTMKEGGIIDKFVELEEVAVKRRINKEEGRSCP